MKSLRSRCCIDAQVVSSANKQIVRGLATLDHKLEDLGVLPPIKQAPLPEEITDDDGNLATDCADVRLLPPRCYPLPLTMGGYVGYMSLSKKLSCHSLLGSFPSASHRFIEHQPFAQRAPIKGCAVE